MTQRFETSHVVLPCGDHSQIYDFSNGQLSPVVKLSYAWGSSFFLFGDKWLATFVKERRRLRIDTINGRKIENAVSFDAPHKGRFYSVRILDNVAFIGGASQAGECMWVVDLAETPPCPKPVMLPPNAQGAGKAVDDFVIRRSTLIAVDDIFLPKYFIRYDIITPDKPTYLSSVEIEPATTNESIQCATEGERVFVTLSSGINYMIATQALVAYDYDTLEPLGSIEESQKLLSGDGQPAWRGVEYHDGLFIVYTNQTVGFIEESRLMQPAQQVVQVGQTREQRQESRPVLKYLPIEILSDGFLSSLTTMTIQDGSALMVGTAKNGEELQHQVFTNLVSRLRQA